MEEMGDHHDEQDLLLLPIANVGRLMKQILPPTTKISKEAKQTIQECATEFISFVTGEAASRCHKENRKTVNGDDICRALSALGFDTYADSMARYLCKYREAEGERGKLQIVDGSEDGESNPRTSQPAAAAAAGKQPETLTLLRLSGSSS